MRPLRRACCHTSGTTETAGYWISAVEVGTLIGQGPENGKAVGIEHIEPLVRIARENMAKSPEGRALLESGKVEFVVGDGRKGYPAAGPYDAIHICAAVREMHKELVDQLKAPGRVTRIEPPTSPSSGVTIICTDTYFPSAQPCRPCEDPTGRGHTGRGSPELLQQCSPSRPSPGYTGPVSLPQCLFS